MSVVLCVFDTTAAPSIAKEDDGDGGRIALTKKLGKITLKGCFSTAFWHTRYRSSTAKRFGKVLKVFCIFVSETVAVIRTREPVKNTRTEPKSCVVFVN